VEIISNTNALIITIYLIEQMQHMMTICLYQNKVSHGSAVVILSHGPNSFCDSSSDHKILFGKFSHLDSELLFPMSLVRK
jgi:hypothetical protein